MAALLGRYHSATTAVLAAADLSAAVRTRDGFPDLTADDHTYVTFIDTAGDALEVCRVSGVQSTPGFLTGLTRGQSGTTARRWPEGTTVVIANDPQLLEEYVAEHAVEAGEGGLTRPQVQALIKQYARAGSPAKIPYSDLQSAADLTSKDHDSLADAGDRIPLIGPSESVDAKISAYELREFVKDDIETQLVPEGGASGEVLKKRSGTNYDVEWAADEEGSDGTTVDTDRLVPAGGSQGQVLRKKTATDYDDEWGDAPGLDGTEVNRRIAARVPDGGAVGQVLKKASATDGDTEWGEDKTNAADIPSGMTFPTSPTAGDRFILTHGSAQQDDHVLQVVQSQTTLRQLHLGGGSNQPNYVRSYATTYSGPSATTLRGKTFVVYSGSGASNPPSTLFFYAPNAARASFTVSGTSAGAGLLNYYEVTGLAYSAFTLGSHRVNVQYADAARYFPDAASDVGDYTYTGTRWDFTPGIAASWAVQGQAEPEGTEVPANRQIPAGGAANQVLAKRTGTDYETFWKNDAGTTEARVNQLISAGVKDWAETGGGDVPIDQLPDDLQLIDRNIVRGGWRSEPLFLVLEADARATAYDRDTARAFNPDQFEESWDSTAQTGNTNVNQLVRVSRDLFHSKPTAQELTRLRLVLDEDFEVAIPLTEDMYLGDDSDSNPQYDFYSVPIPILPAESYFYTQLDAPTELENVSIPAANVVGLRERGGGSAGLSILLDGNINSPGGTPLNSNHNGNATYFSPTFDLDDHPSGIFEVILRVTVATTSQTLSLTRGETNNTATVDGTVSASDLAAKAAFTRADPIEGVLAAVMPVYTVSASTYTEIGRLNLYLVHDANNEVQYLLDYRDNTEHTISGNASWSSHLVVAFQKSDAGSSGGSGGTITATATLPDLIQFGVDATSKTISTVDGRVVESDWSKINLTAAPTAEQGITVNASSEIVFSSPKKISFHAEFVTSGNGSGGGSRIYNELRFTKVGTPNTVVRQSQDGNYQKATNSDTGAQADLTQGPRYQITSMNFPLDAAAGERYIIEWRVYSQENSSVVIDHANSEVDIRCLEPTITITQS